jgi:murein DD-endopeptidase MepM/ murein hydrolase activator NlpD
MLKKKISILLLVVIAVSVSAIVMSTTLNGSANTETTAITEEINSEALTLDSAQMAESFTAQTSEPRLIEYISKAEETVESIAAKYGVTVTTVTLSNNINKDTLLTDGQKLIFPSINGIVYKIKDGENLWDLASAYKINLDDLIAINDFDSPDKLKVGQQIILPSVESLNVEKKILAKATSSSTSVSRGGWPASGKITSKFGPRWGREHKGIDIAVSTGTSVKASMPGKVTFSGWEGGYGYLVKISHGNGLETYYGHNSKLIAKVGQTVDKGTVIAKSGSTGNSTGPHVHFEVRKNGDPVNPYQYLK